MTEITPQQKAMFVKVEWQAREGGGLFTDVEGLGRVEILRANTKLVGFDEGWCVDINGLRHSSAYRDGLSGAMYRMTDEIKTWIYLNSFKEG